MTAKRWHRVRDIGREVVAGWAKHRISQQAAAMSYYFLVTLAPLVLLVVYGLTFILGRVDPAALSAALSSLASGTQGLPDIVGIAQRYAADVGGSEPIVAGAIVLAGGSVLIAQFTGALDVIWDSRPDGSGIRYFVRKRLLGLVGLLVVLCAVVAAILVLNGAGIAVHFLEVAAGGVPTLPEPLAAILDVGEVVTTIAVAALLSFAYTWLPHRTIRWRDTFVGSAITAVLYVLGQFALSAYVTRSAVVSAFGIAGSVIVLVVWIYYTMQVVLGGAELTRVLVQRKERARLETEEAV